MTRSVSGQRAWSIAVAGGGLPGLAFALAIARALGPAIRVTVLDPAFGAPRPSGRAYALSPGAVAMLHTLGVWDGLAGRTAPVLSMTITDGRAADLVRPAYLGFANPDGGPLATMVEADPLADALCEGAGAAGVSMRPTGVEGANVDGGRLSVRLSDGTALPTALLAVADGARSHLREAFGIESVGWAYGQVGIVGTVRHARDHEGRAVQHFLPSGPFATLPLPADASGHRSSIVWTETVDEASRLLSGPADILDRALSDRFGPQFGPVRLDGPLRSFPLSLGIARRAVADRVALLGDAAHHIHPLAGQGLNLGLADAAALAEEVVEAVRLGLDPGGPDGLAAFERARRFDAVRLAAVTDGLNRLFSNDVLAVRALRDVGLGLVDRTGSLKGRLLEAAAGTGARAPRLLRGERL